ncbi:hypothetical protein OH492_00395 [Vibrio chagasii]|nr:hypothetical protein [Vibrio chagasii]
MTEGETGGQTWNHCSAVVDTVDAPAVDLDGPLTMQVSQLDYALRRCGVARVTRGCPVKPNQQVSIIGAICKKRNGKVGTVLGYCLGLDHRHEVEQANAGDIIAITGLGELKNLIPFRREQR